MKFIEQFTVNWHYGIFLHKILSMRAKQERSSAHRICQTLTYRFSLMGKECETQERAARENGYVVLFACDGKVCFHKESASHKIVVVTEQCLQFYDSKSTVPARTIPYFSITDLNVINGKLEITCHTKVHWIKSSKVTEVLAHVRDAFAQLFTEIGLVKFKIQKPVVQSNYMIYIRLLEEMRMKSLEVPNPVLKQLKKAILYQRQDVWIPYGERDSASLILRVLPLCQFVNGLNLGVPVEESDMKWLVQCPSLRYLGISGGITEKFGAFLKESRLFSCGVANSKLTPDELSILENSPCLGFEFHDSIADDAYQYFFETFIPNRAPILLNVDYTKNFNYKALFANGGSLKMLSMAFCGIEIPEVFDLFEAGRLGQLQVLNLSGNRCSVRAKMTVKFPSSLFTLMVNDVAWTNGCLVAFFVMVLNSFVNGVRLSLSRVQASEKEMKHLFKLFGSVTYSHLNSLAWNDNPIDPKFMTLLQNSPYLTSLSVNHCFSARQPELIGKLAEYIKSAENLKFLSIRGGKGNFMEQLTKQILEAVQTAGTVEILDISKSHCGDAGISDFRNCINSDAALRIIEFDGIGPTSIEEYTSLVALNHSKAKTKISYPEKDIKALTQIGNTDAIKTELVNHGQSEMGKPFRVFKYERDPVFPHHISHELEDRLMNETVCANRVGPLPREMSVTDLRSLSLMPTSVPELNSGRLLDKFDAFATDNSSSAWPGNEDSSKFGENDFLMPGSRKVSENVSDNVESQSRVSEETDSPRTTPKRRQTVSDPVEPGQRAGVTGVRRMTSTSGVTRKTSVPRPIPLPPRTKSELEKSSHASSPIISARDSSDGGSNIDTLEKPSSRAKSGRASNVEFSEQASPRSKSARLSNAEKHSPRPNSGRLSNADTSRSNSSRVSTAAMSQKPMPRVSPLHISEKHLSSPLSGRLSYRVIEPASDEEGPEALDDQLTSEHEEEETEPFVLESAARRTTAEEEGLLTDGGEEEDIEPQNENLEEEELPCVTHITTSDSDQEPEAPPVKVSSPTQSSTSHESESKKRSTSNTSPNASPEIVRSARKTPTVRTVTPKRSYSSRSRQNISDNRTISEDPSAPKWEMPQLVDITFHSNIWTEKAMSFKMSSLVAALKEE